MYDPRSNDGIETAQLIKSGKLSALEVMEATISRIDALDPELNCIPIKNFEMALEQAKAFKPSDHTFPLAGTPWLRKDMSLMKKGTITTNSLRPLANFVAPHDSLIVSKLSEAGLMYLGKSAVPENGFCISCESPLRGPMRNAWDSDHIGGGSSGGAGVSVGARILHFAHASDGAGSIRIPASFNGVFGMKFTRGGMSYAPDYADIWYGNAVEGCVSISVRDSAAYYDIIAGNSEGELYNFTKPELPYLDSLRSQPRPLKIGVWTEPDTVALDAECRAGIDKAIKLLESLGHHVEPFQYSNSSKELIDTFIDVAGVCAGAGKAGIDMLLGQATDAGDYTQVNWELAEKGRLTSGVQHYMDVEKMHILGRTIAVESSRYDVILSPTMPTPPAKLGTYNMEQSLENYLKLFDNQLTFTLPYSVSGQPAMSVPLHWTESGLPVGIQFAANMNNETLLFQLAAQLEEAAPWKNIIPQIAK